jgi:hypothetical protein
MGRSPILEKLFQDEFNDRLCRENPTSGKMELLAGYYPKENV